MPDLKTEIAQAAPFSSVEEEAILNLVRTSDFMQRGFQQKLRCWGLTMTQYNVLRILRGAGPEGLPCAEIGARMLTADPDITRLLGRLKRLRLIRQHRDRQDRRIVWTQISDAGMNLLHSIDPIVQRIPVELLGHMKSADLKEMIRLLELARRPCRKADAHRQ